MEIGKLTSLKVLYLHKNSLTGDFLALTGGTFSMNGELSACSFRSSLVARALVSFCDACPTDFGGGQESPFRRDLDYDFFARVVLGEWHLSAHSLWRSDLPMPPAIPARWYGIVPARTSSLRRLCVNEILGIYIAFFWLTCLVLLPTHGRDTGSGGASNI